MTDPAIITAYDLARARTAAAWSRNMTNDLMEAVRSRDAQITSSIASPEIWFGHLDGLVDVLIARGVGV